MTDEERRALERDAGMGDRAARDRVRAPWSYSEDDGLYVVLNDEQAAKAWRRGLPVTTKLAVGDLVVVRVSDSHRLGERGPVLAAVLDERGAVPGIFGWRSMVIDAGGHEVRGQFFGLDPERDEVVVVRRKAAPPPLPGRPS